MRLYRCLMASILLLFSFSVMAQTSPVPMLENVAQKILVTLKNNKSELKKNPEIIRSAVQRYLLPVVDTRGMARSVLGRQAWNKATPAERDQFIRAFTKLVIRTYANPLAEYTDETIQFLPIRGSVDSRFLRVNSVIKRSNGQNVPLSYSLVSKGANWKIYDLSVEGVSLLQSFRSQFAQALQSSSMKKLIEQLEKKASAA
ncbi:phospholipid-binding protein MlaC [Legionella sp. W05-934-2]|uniref:MlaC/ttg2D family ABC transporter substrate-binding protein n=1 Tax=Legionella sp. W05-934-2 TaxID=1198649 RepID=UPI003462B4BD